MAKPTHPPTPRPRYSTAVQSTIMWDSYVRAFLINQKRSTGEGGDREESSLVHRTEDGRPATR